MKDSDPFQYEGMTLDNLNLPEVIKDTKESTEEQLREDTEEYFDPPESIDFFQNQNNPKSNKLIDTARSFVGTRYTWGGKKPETGFDCSGFISYVFKENGINVPSSTAEIFNYGQSISLEDAKVGDIICLSSSGPTGRHVKLISDIDKNGNIYTIEAKGKKDGIVEELLTNTNNIVSIRRVSTQKFNSRKQFVSTLENTYRELLTKRGYNPDFASILVAQDANESGWGKNLAGNFNYGGIKSKTGSKKKTTEYINGVKQTYYDSFRDFNSLEDFCNFKIDLLSSSRYNIFNTTNPDNPEEVFTAINTRGYSTTPNHIYVPQLLKVYNNVIQLS